MNWALLPLCKCSPKEKITAEQTEGAMNIFWNNGSLELPYQSCRFDTLSLLFRLLVKLNYHLVLPIVKVIKIAEL